MVDVTLNQASAPGKPVVIAVKIQSPAWELNFRATPEELAGLSSIREADWAARRCLHIGESAGTSVHWSAEGDTAIIMVGRDDETWDIAVTVPVATVEAIAADNCSGEPRPATK